MQPLGAVQKYTKYTPLRSIIINILSRLARFGQILLYITITLWCHEHVMDVIFGLNSPYHITLDEI